MSDRACGEGIKLITIGNHGIPDAFYFQTLNGHIFRNRAENKWYTFFCTNGRFRYMLYRTFKANRYTYISIYIYIYIDRYRFKSVCPFLITVSHGFVARTPGPAPPAAGQPASPVLQPLNAQLLQQLLAAQAQAQVRFPGEVELVVIYLLRSSEVMG